MRLPTGADARLTNPGEQKAVVCVNGGTAREVEGTWSATLEWLVRRLAPGFPRLTFVEVRYRVKSWKQLPSCIDDCRAALDGAVDGGAEEVALLGFSMGGAVSIAAADQARVTTVIGLAPWIPNELDVAGLDGRRLAIVQGSLDRPVLGIPGVSPRSSLRGYERIRARDVDSTYSIVSGGLHGLALRRPGGGLVALPRAGHWASLVAGELRRFEVSDSDGRPRLK